MKHVPVRLGSPRRRGNQGNHPPDVRNRQGHSELAGGMTPQTGARKTRRLQKTRPSLKGLIAEDLAEFGDSSARAWQAVPHWTAAESAVLNRFAAAVTAGRYADAVLADCAVPTARGWLARGRQSIAN